MMLENTLNLKRLSQLILTDLREHTKIIWLTIATIFLLQIFNFDHYYFGSLGEYFLILYIGGALITASAFSELRDRLRAASFLMLPCSNLERFLSKWLLTSVIFIAISLLCYLISSCIFNVGTHLLFNKKIMVFEIFKTNDLWEGFGKYLILQSVILLGAITFKKFPLIKTILISCFILIAMTFFIVFLSWYVYCPNCIVNKLLPSLINTIDLFKYLFLCLLAPFCLYLTYLKINEFELR